MPDDPAPGWSWTQPVVPIGIGLLFLVACVLLARRSWSPNFDFATMELNVRDVGRHTPLVGPYSRYGWFHPGPLLYVLLAIPYRLLGGRSIDLAVGAAAINGATLAAIAVVARRRGGLGLVGLTLASTGLLACSLGSTLVDPWAPYVTVLPFVLFVLLAWSGSAGDAWWALPAGAAVGTFLVQSHVGYTAAVLALGLWLVGWFAAAVVRGDEGRRRLLYGGIVTVVMLGVLWAPVVWQQLTQDPGNLTMLWRYFRHPGSASAGFDLGANIVARQLTVPAPWMGASEHLTPLTIYLDPQFSPAVPVGLLALVVTTGVAVVRRDRVWQLGAVVLVSLVCGWVSMASITGPAVAYLARWTWALGMLTWLAALWTAWVLARDRLPHRAGRGVGVAVGAVAVGVMGVLAVNLVQARPTLDSSQDPTADLARDVLAELGPEAEDTTIYVRSDGPYPIGEGMLLQLERLGARVVASPFPTGKFGMHREHDDRERVVTLLVTQGAPSRDADRVDELKVDPTLTLVAESDPLGRAARRELGAALLALERDPDDPHAAAIVARRWDEPALHVGVFRLPHPDARVP